MNIDVVESLYEGAISLAAARRILSDMEFPVSKVVSASPKGDKIEVFFRQGSQDFVVMLTPEHFFGDYFQQRWLKSFDYDVVLDDAQKLAHVSQGPNAESYWVKIHGHALYECDCPDYVSQYQKRGFAVCKHCVTLARHTDVSISDLINAQTQEPQIGVA